MHLQRQEYVDVPMGTLPQGCDFFQPKHDGIWINAIWDGLDQAVLVSRTGEIKGTLKVPSVIGRYGPFSLVGEYLVSQQRAVGSPDYGKVFFFDCLKLAEQDYSAAPYRDRVRVLRHLLESQIDDKTNWRLTQNYPLSHFHSFWSQQVATGVYEGVVFRKWMSGWNEKLLRSKMEYTVDMIICGAKEGNGKYEDTLGALQLKFYDSNVIVECSGMDDNMRNHLWSRFRHGYLNDLVVEVKCKGFFSSGSLRHPNFVRIRDDKLPNQCLRPQNLSLQTT